MVTGIIAASLLTPFFLEVTPEVRSTYQSLGKIVEDRPMQVTNMRFGYDSGRFGRFGIRNWDVSSLSDRRHDAHRHAVYHTEFGPTWDFDFDIADDWRLKTGVTRSWTMYRGFTNSKSDRTYHWWQVDQSLENPYLVPFYRMRKCFRGNDYFYFKVGLRRKFEIFDDVYFTPSVFAEGGSSRNFERVIGKRPDGRHWDDGVSSLSLRLEFSWRYSDMMTLFAYVEQYEVIGSDERRINGESTYRCAHNDWTHGGIGMRLSF
jgi:hypothetical protein